MPIIDLQTRSRELGRIRLGVKETFTKRNGEQGTRPSKLDRFRLTSSSQPLLEKVAELYGGHVEPWTPDGGSPAFEVITDARRLPILVPNQPITQWYEAWRKSGCVHRCTGAVNVLTDEPCDPEDPLHREATEKPTTRLNVVLRDVEGIGVWRVETKGWHAATELPDVAEFLAQAGGYVAGWLALEQRTSIDTSGPKPVTQHFMVPIIEIDVTPAQLLAGGGRVSPSALTGGPVPAAAIEAPAEQQAAAPAEQAPKVVIPTPEQVDSMSANPELMRRTLDYLGQHGAGEHPATQAVRARLAALVPDADGVVDGVVVEDPPASPAAPAAAPVEEPNPEAVWQQIVTHAGTLGWTLDKVRGDFTDSMGMDPGEASGHELTAYLQQMVSGEPVSA